ncbi:hypothetical protein BaRGS_00002719, partial [Batillaria attramentaria]
MSTVKPLRSDPSSNYERANTGAGGKCNGSGVKQDNGLGPADCQRCVPVRVGESTWECRGGRVGKAGRAGLNERGKKKESYTEVGLV